MDSKKMNWPRIVPCGTKMSWRKHCTVKTVPDSFSFLCDASSWKRRVNRPRVTAATAPSGPFKTTNSVPLSRYPSPAGAPGVVTGRENVRSPSLRLKDATPLQTMPAAIIVAVVQSPIAPHAAAAAAVATNGRMTGA